MQCIRVYSKECAELRTTKIQKLTPDERKSIPTENLSCEISCKIWWSGFVISCQGQQVLQGKNDKG